jgi:hypothetical protein
MFNKRLIPVALIGVVVLITALLVMNSVFNSGGGGSKDPTLAVPGVRTPTGVSPFSGPVSTSTPRSDATSTPYPLIGIGQDSPNAVRTFPPPLPVFTPAPVDWVLKVEDDFSDPAKLNIPTIRMDQMTAKYYQNSYQMYVALSDQMGFVSKDVGFANQRIEVDTKLVAGNKLNMYGVLCRFFDKKNYYYFGISNGGGYSFGKVVNGKNSSFLPDSYMPSDSINRDTESPNHIKAICNGATLFFYVNGTLIASAADTDLTTGTRFGFMADGGNSQEGTNIYFNNLKIFTTP